MICGPRAATPEHANGDGLGLPSGHVRSERRAQLALDGAGLVKGAEDDDDHASFTGPAGSEIS